MDIDLSLDDILLSAYRLSWPATTPRARRRDVLRRSARAVLLQCKRQHFQGWVIPLSVPATA